MFPPVPESPNRQLPSKSSGTPRVGMHLYQNDDDDDVSVLTFHTLGAKDVANHHQHNVGGNNINNNSSYIKSARESLERLVLESKEASGDDSLARISEEDGSHQSQMSSCHSKSKSSSTTKGEEKEKTVQEETEEDGGNYDENDDDDDTISLAESILTSASKVLSNIGSSPYYAGRNKRGEVSSSTATKLRESPLPKPNPKHPSPMKQPIKSTNDTEKDEDKKYMKYVHESNNQTYSKVNQMPSHINNDDTNSTRLEVSSTFLRSYFHDDDDDDDENTKPYVNRYSRDGTTINKNVTKGGSSKGTNGDEHIQQLESETKKLHALLKECQSETKKSTQTLGTSIKKANELLERISSGRMM